MEIPLSNRYTILERIAGHVPKIGKSAGEELNWAYRLLDTQNNEECVGMFCKPNHITLIDKDIWNELATTYKSSITWYLGSQGYITRTVKEKEENPYIYLHQLVTKHIGAGKGKQSIDHSNQNKFDNRLANLRIVGQGEQNKNRGKVSRHANAKELPKELEGVTLPKFCVYYKECYNKEKELFREFFTIEGHPNLEGKRKATTKSSKKTILEKFDEAINILSELDLKSLSPKEIEQRVICGLCDQLFLDENDRNLIIEKTDKGDEECYYCSTCYEMRGHTSLNYFLDHIKEIYMHKFGKQDD